jgi:hypothetical protein
MLETNSSPYSTIKTESNKNENFSMETKINRELTVFQRKTKFVYWHLALVAVCSNLTSSTIPLIGTPPPRARLLSRPAGRDVHELIGGLLVGQLAELNRQSNRERKHGSLRCGVSYTINVHQQKL